MKIKWIGWIFTILVMAAAVSYITRTYFPQTVETTKYIKGSNDTTIVHDTLRIVITRKAKIDTVLINNQEVEVASLDTTLIQPTGIAQLSLSYLGSPFKVFSLSGTIMSDSKIITRVDTLRIETEKTGWFLDRIDIGVGIAPFYYNDKIHFQPTLGVYYRIL